MNPLLATFIGIIIGAFLLALCEEFIRWIRSDDFDAGILSADDYRALNSETEKED